MTEQRTLDELLKELDTASPIRSAELARQVEIAAESLRTMLSGSEQVRAAQQAAQAATDALQSIAHGQAQMASLLREQTEAISRLHDDRVTQLLKQQENFQRMLKIFSDEQDRLRRLLAEHQRPGA